MYLKPELTFKRKNCIFSGLNNTKFNTLKQVVLNCANKASGKHNTVVRINFIIFHSRTFKYNNF